MSKGTIFDIVEFAVHDGPGIRKTVFFKGCPLRCRWCHNPEGISFEKEVIKNKLSCRICGYELNAIDLAEKLLKDSELLRLSSGGVTISGGEPLAQPEFLLELIELLKPLNVAVETSGYAAEDTFRRVVCASDIILMDVKHTDTAVHKQFTGVDNCLVLKNLEYLCSAEKKFYIRIPLIPGVNDTEENMESTAALLKHAKGLERIELLPYHKTAGAKYSMLGKEYNPGFDVDKAPKVYLKPFEKYNIRSAVL